MLMSRSGQWEAAVKIIDFGVARLPQRPGQSAESTQSGIVLGTPLYMPPEQCYGASNVDAKADVYALGITLYQMLAGRTPFVADEMGVAMMMQIEQTPPPLPDSMDLPSGLTALLALMLAKPSAQRPPMDEVAKALTEIEAEQALKGPSGRTKIQASAAMPWPSPQHEQQAETSFLDELGSLVQRRLTQEFSGLSQRVLQKSAERWPLVSEAIAKIQIERSMPRKADSDGPKPGMRTVSLDRSGDLAFGWLIGLNLSYRDITFKLSAQTLVGTAPGCDIILADPMVSARHCEIRKVEGGFKLLDLGATNGVVVNDKRMREHFLVDGDSIRLGRLEFKFKSIF